MRYFLETYDSLTNEDEINALYNYINLEDIKKGINYREFCKYINPESH